MDINWLEAVLKRQEYDAEVVKVTGVQIESAVPKGQNFLGVIKRAKINVILGSGRRTTQYAIVKGELGAKLNDALGNITPFKIEIKIYKNVLPKMESLMEEFCDKSETLWGQMLDCTEYSSLIFEDLTVSGYKVAKRQNGLDYAHSVLALRSLARFHAMSRVLFQRGLISDGDYGVLQFLTDTPLLENFYEAALLQLSSVMKSSWPPEWIGIAERIEKYSSGAYLMLKSLAEEKNERDFPVLNHGDVWICNLMFLYSGDEKSPLGMKFIDFQMCHHSSYKWDLTNLLFGSVRADVRRERFDDLLNAYCDSLTSSLKMFGFDGRSPDIQDVRETMSSMNVLAWLIVAVGYPIITADCTDAFDLEKIADKTTSFSAFNPDIFNYKHLANHTADDIKCFANKGVF